MQLHQQPLLSIQHLQKRYTSTDHLAIRDVTIDVFEHEFVSIVGPSGCGKTTLLKTMSGLLHPTTGTVKLAGELVNGPPPGMLLVFQDYAASLFPWLTVYENVAFPFKKGKLAKSEWQPRVDEALEAVGLRKAFANHFPWQLSGGMQQRVAIARALAFQPKVLLLDEPFASVDALTRADLEDLILRLCRTTGITMLLVTHDIEEAVYLSDRVFVLSTPPAQVLKEVKITLPALRNQVTTRSDWAFIGLRNEIHALIGQPGAGEAASPLAAA